MSPFAPRKAFTLVELLVAVALTIAIIGIIGWAMGKSVDTFRNLNGIANLQTKLVAAQIVMQRDLSAEHFGGVFRPGFGGPYVADQRLDRIGWTPPDEGHFEIRQGSEGTFEGTDADGLWSARSVDHSLRFTARFSGRREEDWFYAYPDNAANTLPAAWGDVNFNRGNGIAGTPVNGIAVRWAEIAYFLSANGQTANGTPLYTLYRQQLAIQGTAGAVTASPPSRFLSRTGGPLGNGYNSSSTVTNPASRGIALPGVPASVASAGGGDDILITDVISFEIKVLWSNGPASSGFRAARLGPAVYYGATRLLNCDWPFDTMEPLGGGWNMRFDTMSRTIAPANTTNWDDASADALAVPPGFRVNNNNLPRYRVRVEALQIRIRIWDFNTQQTRQVTFVQDI